MEAICMEYVKFDDDEKIKMFDEISNHFYNKNFGQFSKSEIELMMFNFYIQKMIKDSLKEDGTIDYGKCSDYRISKDLGITQQRVRNLKVKNQLVNPLEFDWKKEIAALMPNARYENKKVYINIPDSNLFYEIQNFLENEGSYIEKQLNSKLLVIRIEYFIDLLMTLEEEPNKRKIEQKIKKACKEQLKTEKKFDENNIGKSLIECTENITTILASISEYVSPENVIYKALVKLLNLK